MLPHIGRIFPHCSVYDALNLHLARRLIADHVCQVSVQPLVELHKVWQELASSLQALPLEGEAREEGDVVTSDVTRAEDAVREVFFAGIVGIVQLQTPVQCMEGGVQYAYV